MNLYLARDRYMHLPNITIMPRQIDIIFPFLALWQTSGNIVAIYVCLKSVHDLKCTSYSYKRCFVLLQNYYHRILQ